MRVTAAWRRKARAVRKVARRLAASVSSQRSRGISQTGTSADGQIPAAGDAHVEAAQGGDRRRHQAIGVVLAPQVGPDGAPRPGRRPVPRRRPARCGSAPPPGTPRRRGRGRRRSRCPRAAGDQRRLACQAGVHGPSVRPGLGTARPSRYSYCEAVRRKGAHAHPRRVHQPPHLRRVRGRLRPAGSGTRIRRAARVLDDRRVPLAGLVAAFVFAAQMVNFPVASGTSGHLLGGVLAAVLVGPWLGALALTVVLVVQGVFFADGGLSALGFNVFNMAIVGALGGYLLYRGPRRPPAQDPAGHGGRRRGGRRPLGARSPPSPSSSSTPSAARAGPASARWPPPWSGCTPSSASERA